MKLRNFTRALLACTLVTLLLAGVSAQAQTFTYQPVQIAGAIRTDVYCLNSSGFLVGSYQDVNFVNHAFLLANGTLTEIIPPGSSYTLLLGVNASKVVSGYYLDSTFTVAQAFTWQNGAFTLLTPTPSSGTVTSSIAFQINNAGKVVGSYTDSLGGHGYTFQNGIYTTFNVPLHTNTAVFGVNNVGATTVQALDSGSAYDSYYLNALPVPANIPGAVSSYIHGLNLSNTAVYSYTDALGVFRGAGNYRGRNQFFPVMYPNSQQTFANSITEANVIAGNVVLPDTTVLGFIARPQGMLALKLPAAFNTKVVLTGKRFAPAVDAGANNAVARALHGLTAQ